MKIAIFGRSYDEEAAPFIETMLESLIRKGAELLIYKNFLKHIKLFSMRAEKIKTFELGEQITDADFFFSIGGDGTVLETVTYVRDSGIPIMGINTGHLGFLSTTSKEYLNQAIEDIYKGTFTIDKRMLLKLESDKDLFGDMNFALNDLVIHKSDTSSMITIHTYINGEFLNSYWSDGLLVATPTGSTGYSLSCGGPIVFPQSGNMLITPISPHNLSVRPIVVSDRAVISFEVESRTNSFLVSLDSRSKVVDTGIQMAVKKEDFSINLIRLYDENFLFTLRNKLNWGLDIRN